MTHEENIAYQNGILTALAINKVIDLSEFKRQEIIQDMAEINQPIPADSTWSAIHKAIRSWNISGPFVKLIENFTLQHIQVLEIVNVNTDLDNLNNFDFVELLPLTVFDNVTVTLI